MNQKEKHVKPLDLSWYKRWLHLHCFQHIYKLLTSKNSKSEFAYPRFKLFKEISFNRNKTNNRHKTANLFTKILTTFLFDLFIGSIITIIFASLNLLIPLIIKNVLNFMHNDHLSKDEIMSTQILIEGFFFLQLFRIIFGQHSKRLFYELAIKIESSLSIMLVKKALVISHDVRHKIPQSQILHLENVDLKLVFLMFQNMYLIIQAPFTILVAIYLLYLQNYKYGLIGIYWFLIAFLLQRQLDQKMTHCNDTKLNLIEARSKINYQIFGKVRLAKLLGHQQLLLQKNNDYFIQENHDHKIFYEYVTLYDITLILLPILVIVTIALYDLNQPDQISVQQVYVLLSLLGICYNPMKSFRTMRINFHDGLRSLKRIEQFLLQQDQAQNSNLKLKFLLKTTHSFDYSLKTHNAALNKFRQNYRNTIYPLLKISKNLIMEPEQQNSIFKLQINLPQDIQLYKSQRLVVMGKLASGIQSFIAAIIGTKRIKSGQISLNDRIAYLDDQYFFRNTTVRQNIRFFNLELSDEKIQTIYKQLKLDQDLILSEGLNGNIDDQYKYNKVQLHKISLARILCSNADIYLLDKVFEPLNQEDQILVQQILRSKQKQGKLIILANNSINYFSDDDKVIIIDKGEVIQYSDYRHLLQTENPYFKKFHKVQTKEEKKSEDIFDFLAISMAQKMTPSHRISQEQFVAINRDILNPVFVYAVYLWSEYQRIQHLKISNKSIGYYILKFLRSIKIKQFIYIFFIIAVAELMHIFIHFYIGHLQEEHGQNNYVKFKNMIIVQFVLTLGLCGVIYLQGEVSSYIAIIQGNNIYKNSLVALSQNKLSWFLKEYSVKIANRFNHDYQEVFIALHMFLNIYKNIVILIATIFFLSQTKQLLIKMTLAITVTYFTVYYILRAVEKKVVNYYEEYKYHYVKILQESVGGAKYINLYGASKDLISSAKKAYLQTASYKIAQSYTAYGQQIICDMVSLIIFTAVLYYGLKSKMQGNSKSIAIIATMIHLLIGVFDVLKNIVKDAVNFQSFFKINLLPIVQVIKEKTPETLVVQEHISESNHKYKQSQSSIKSSVRSPQSSMEQSKNQTKLKSSIKNLEKSRSDQKLARKSSIGFLQVHDYDIHFNNVTLHESKHHEPAFEIYPLNLRIEPGQKVLICQSNDYLKNYLIYGLTKNLPMFFNTEVMGFERTLQQIRKKQNTIVIGGRDICCIQKLELESIIQIIIDHDFYIQGTLQDNIAWKNPNYQQKKALKLAEFLEIYYDLPDIKNSGLKAKIVDPSKQLIKKITFLRIILLEPKIIIIKDTQSIVGRYRILEEIDKYLGAVTIIKISSNMAEAFDVDRIILTRNLNVIQDRLKQDALQNPLSQIGRQVKKANIQGFIYMNQMSASLSQMRYKNTL